MRIALILFAAASTVACSAAPEIRERGWIGEETRSVDADALLLVDLPAESPLARAGLKPGDLLVELAGAPVGDPLEFREAVEALPPGERAELEYRRGGATRRATVVVGAERYHRQGTVGIGLFFSPEIDLWPFDDGVNVLGLIALESDSRRPNLHSVERRYAEANAGDDLPPAVGEELEFRILPLMLGKRTIVLAQAPK